MRIQENLGTLLTRMGAVLAIVLLISACAAPLAGPAGGTADETEAHNEGEEEHAHAEALPELSAVYLGEGEKLRVVATTNILGDVVHNIGDDLIELTILLPVGADPHSYNAAPNDLRNLSGAHAIFMVGEGIEEAMLSVLENREGNAALIAVNTGIELRAINEDEHAAPEDPADGEEVGESDESAPVEEVHSHQDVDPHTWTSVANVIHWVEIIEHTLSTLDPANAAAYKAAAAAYTGELETLDTEIQTALSAIPAESHKLVTDHETFSYFAARYGFEVIGSVIPSFSTLAAPSAQDLAALQDQIVAEGVKAIFVGSTVNPDLAEQIAADLGVVVVSLYADSLSAPDGPAATYIDLMRYNVNAIVEALK